MADEIKLKAPTVEQQVNVVINGEEKLKSFASTLENIASNKNLQKYWKDQKQLIDDVTDAYSNFTKNTSKNNALELMKTTNALKALSDVDISSLIPDFKNFSQALENAKKVAGSLDSAFSVNSFKDAFSSFETLRAYGIDLENFFKHFELDINVTNLQESLKLAQQETRRVRRELSETQEELSSKKIELASFIDGSGLTEQIEKLRYLEDELRYVREQASEEFRTFLKGNDFSGWDLYENGAFERYFNEIRDGSLTAKEAIANFKSEYSYLLQEKFNESGGLFNLQQVQVFENKLETVLSRVEEISRQMNDIVENGVMTKAMQNLSVDNSISQSQRDLFANVLKDEEALSSIAGVLKKIIDESATLQGVNNKTFDEEQFSRLLILFEKIESSLSSMKAVFVDVGDGEEFSPLLKMINNVQESVNKLSSSVKGIGLNMNIDVGSDSEMEAKVQSKISNALQAYQRLFDHIKMSGAGGSMINTNFFEFDINQYDTMMAKLQAYKKFIENMRKEAKTQFNGKDVLYQDTDKSYWTAASAEMGQVTKAFNEIKASSDINPLENLFGGKTDLTEVVSQLNLIVNKLGEISTTASEFKNAFANGFNVSASVEEIEKLTSRVKELETELSKVKVGSTSTPIKDTFQRDAKASAESSVPAVKEEAKAMEQVAENAEKASKGKDNFAKANKKVKESADSSADSIEKENSTLDASVWEKNLKAIQEYMDANTKLNNLMAKDKGTGKHASDIARQEKEVEKLKESAIEARAALSSMVNPHEAPIDDWGKWVEAMEKFEQATKGSAESVAKLEDALRSARNAQLSSIDSTINNSRSKLDDFSARKVQSDAYKNSLIELGETIERLRTLRASLSNTRAFTDEEQAQIDALTQSVRDHVKEIQRMSAGEKGSDALSRDKWANRIREYMDKNTRLTREFREELENLIRILRTGGDSVVLKDVIGQFEDAKFRIKEAKLEGKSFFDIFKDKAVYGFAAKLAQYYLSFYDFIRYARYAVNALVELDSALLDLKKTTTMTGSQLDDFYYASNDVAKQMGVTTAQIIEQASAWSRLGYSSQEAATKMAQLSSQFASISPGMETDQAQEGLVSIMKANIYCLYV